MEEKKMGAPKKPIENHKKNRAISLTDKEYLKLKELAKEMKLGVSAFIIKKFKLDK